MWIFATTGFFSIVQKPGTDFLTVRARVASDLDNLHTKFMPQLSPTIKGGGTDYPFRATISHQDFGAGLAKMGEAITYHKVWHDLFDLQSTERG